jgi:hypothetical protein
VASADAFVWTPDPKLATQLKQRGEVGKYHILLPPDFTLSPKVGVVPANMQLAIWMGKIIDNKPPPFLSFAIFSDQKMAKEAKANMRQTLVNYSAGYADPMGIQIATREKTETGSLDGMAFSRFKWTGMSKDRTPVRGLAYGAVNNDEAISLLAIGFGTNAEKDIVLLQTIIATLKKQ